MGREALKHVSWARPFTFDVTRNRYSKIIWC